MENQIEIYVRHSNEKAMLMIHVPDDLRESFLKGLNRGLFQTGNARMHLELSVLPDWIPDEIQRAELASLETPVHARLEIASITIL